MSSHRGEFHQLTGAMTSGAEAFRIARSTRRFFVRFGFLPSHAHREEAIRLRMNDFTHFHANRQSQCESITEPFNGVHHGTLPVPMASCKSQRETTVLAESWRLRRNCFFPNCRAARKNVVSSFLSKALREI
jgi:hypothetical protein